MDSDEEVARVLAEVRDVMNRTREEVTALRQELAGVEAAKNQRVLPFAPPPAEEQLVSLDQMAARLGMSKRGLERHTKGMPPPAIRGRRGRSAKWIWAHVRPWLEKTFGRQLPERFNSLTPPPEW